MRKLVTTPFRSTPRTTPSRRKRESSADYNPSPGLERITAALVAINSADDERNPIELGILEREIKRVKNGRYG